MILPVIIKGTIGSKTGGNSPEAKAKRLGIKAKRTAAKGPKKKTASIKDMLTRDPVTG